MGDKEDFHGENRPDTDGHGVGRLGFQQESGGWGSGNVKEAGVPQTNAVRSSRSREAGAREGYDSLRVGD